MLGGMIHSYFFTYPLSYTYTDVPRLSTVCFPLKKTSGAFFTSSVPLCWIPLAVNSIITFFNLFGGFKRVASTPCSLSLRL